MVAAAVLVEIGLLPGPLRHHVGLVLARLQRATEDEGGALVEHGLVSGGVQIEPGDPGEPEQVVREPGPDPAARGRVPPVEHVALRELVGRVFQDLAPEPGRVEPDQRHGVLELVTEAKRAARLVERGPAVEPTADVLVRQPAVHHEVQRRGGRADAYAAQQPTPRRPGALQRGDHGLSAPVGSDQLQGGVTRRCLAQQQRALDRLTGGQIQAALEGGAGVLGVRRASRQADGLPERGGRGDVAIPAQEGGSVGGDPDGLAFPGRDHDRERHVPGEVLAGGVPDQDRPQVRTELCFQRRCRLRPRRPEDPLEIAEHGEPPGLVSPVGDAQADQLHRVIRRHEQPDVVAQALAFVAVVAVAEPMPCLVRAVTRHRAGQRRPVLAALLVTQVERLAVAVAHRVVRPRRETVETAVATPAEAGARLGGHEPDGLVRDDVDPRQGRERPHAGTGAEQDHILVASLAEAAVPVEEAQRLIRRSNLPGREGGRPPRRTGEAVESQDALGIRRSGPDGSPGLAPRGVQRRSRRGRCSECGRRGHRVDPVEPGGQHCRERAFLARFEGQLAAQAEDRVQHVADAPRERRSRVQRPGRGHGAAAAQEDHPVRLEGRRGGHRVIRNQQVDDAHGVVFGAAGPAVGRQRLEHRVVRRLDEELGERRMARERRRVIERDRHAGGDLEMAHGGAAVGQRQATQLRRARDRHRYLQHGQDAVILTADPGQGATERGVPLGSAQRRL
jgi:hypothetical protein